MRVHSVKEGIDRHFDRIFINDDYNGWAGCALWVENQNVEISHQMYTWCLFNLPTMCHLFYVEDI